LTSCLLKGILFIMLEEIDQKPLAIYTVSDLNGYIRAVLESNENLMDIWVTGEVSNVSQPRSGHIYFTLKDEGAQVRCVIWRSHAGRLAGTLRDGMLIEAHGAVGVYEGGGQYQLYVDGVRTAGEGRLFQEFLRLKEALSEEGLFDASRKREIPQLPSVIGIVTSATGAALQDMLNTLRGRYPLVDVVLAPASVQGDAAPLEIVSALENLNRHIHPDVILLGRGGGSLEDLWAFNDERVVRAIVNSEAPVISGIGHETDFTLSDFAADLRAPTPTGAAVAAVPDRMELLEWLNGYRADLLSQIRTNLDSMQTELRANTLRLLRVSPKNRIRQNMQTIDQAGMVLRHLQERYFLQQQRLLEIAAGKLSAYDPRSILKRGYAIISDSSGALISSVKQVQLGMEMHACVQDGTINASVSSIHPQKEIEDGKKE
jgi:exodeoxyribonuclease VII large subunit